MKLFPRWLHILAMLAFACTAPKATAVTLSGERVPNVPKAEACADAPLVSFDQLQRGERVNERVAVEGIPQPELACTQLACADGSICCNHCGGGYVLLQSPTHRIALEALEGCSGGACEVECRPFGNAPTKSYRFIGTHRFEPAGQTALYARSRIEVEQVCRLFSTAEDFADLPIDGEHLQPD